MTNRSSPDLPENVQKKLSRRLAFALGVSCFVNVSLLAFGLYEWQEGGYSFLVHCPYRPQKVGQDKAYMLAGKSLSTMTQALREYEALVPDDLFKELANVEPICEGYRRRDIALSLLVGRHFFDLQRALGSPPAQRRQFRYFCKENVPSEITLYPALTDEHFAKVSAFAKIERYPLTSQGLFEKLKSCKEQELKEAFMMTDEYRCADILLRRGTRVSKERAEEFIQSCDWNSLHALYDEMRASQSFTPEVRRAFLVKALPHSSGILLETDPRFVLHSLQDAQILSLLGSPTLAPEQKKALCIALLESPRSDAVWNGAIALFCEISALDPDQETRASILQRSGKKIASKATPKADSTLAPPATKPKPATAITAKPQSKTQPLPVAKAAPKPVPKPLPKSVSKADTKTNKSPVPTTAKSRDIVHTVQAGDTLWKLAKRYKVDVERIKKRNNLKSDSLKPGTILYIPAQPTVK